MTRQWIAKVERGAGDAPLGKVIVLSDLLGLELELREPEISDSAYADLKNTARLDALLSYLRKSARDVPTAEKTG